MQLLVPPLDDRGDFSKRAGSATADTSKTRSVMSQGLRDKFESMKHVWNQSPTVATKRATSEHQGVAAAASEQDDHGEEARVEQQHENKKRRIAMETAFAIESEVQKWQRGIAELEAMLDETGDDLEGAQGSSSSPSGDARARPPEIVRFPSLPPIVPAEDGDFEAIGREEAEENQEEDEPCQGGIGEGNDDDAGEEPADT